MPDDLETAAIAEHYGQEWFAELIMSTSRKSGRIEVWREDEAQAECERIASVLGRRAATKAIIHWSLKQLVRADAFPPKGQSPL